MIEMVKYYCKLIIVTLLFSLIIVQCNSQIKERGKACTDRQPVVAGSFYPDKPEALEIVLESMFAKAEKRILPGDLKALLVPHAGYVYSGKVAAEAYKLIDTEKKYDNIFIIASSHQKYMQGASIYNQGDYVTPLGKVKVNRDLANQLIEANNNLFFDPEAHAAEHSLEVQLPFLQYRLKTDFQIVPIVTGFQDVVFSRKLASILKPYLNENNLFIISSDFSHYPAYQHAVVADERTGQAILAKSPRMLISAINTNASENFPNLVTSLCGWPGVLTFLYMIETESNIDAIHIKYMNSGDVTKDSSRVVGYHSIAFVKNENKVNMTKEKFNLDDEEKKYLLDLARQTIESFLTDGSLPEIEEEKLSESLREKCGAFVTLHKKGSLRGCIGRFTSNENLAKVVQSMAVSAATQDPRFSKVKPSEMGNIDIEISVLTPLKEIKSIDEIEMGKHGIYIKKGFATGTFLPQVALQTGWTKEEFLGHCSRDKAGLGWEGWKDAEIYIYEALVFSENQH